MCDTLVALPACTSGGHLILAKNSDREPNEAQVIERIPARDWEKGALSCTYIRVPQIEHTYEVILSRPFQMWGSEMGANEHGVVIGNEAVFTRFPMEQRNTGLTGMDLLRLALERSATASEALACITTLLETYGQNACGGYENRKFFYHNSFLIAGKDGAWVLETADRHWAARRVNDYYSISNGLTIGAGYDLISNGAADAAYSRHWLRNDEPFDFNKAFSDWFFTRMSSCRHRRLVTQGAVGDNRGLFSKGEAMQVLATHQLTGGRFSPRLSTTSDICMHATGLTNPSQTTGSMVAEIRRDLPSTIWLTGTSMPCLSVYLPFFFGGTTLQGAHWLKPGPKADASLWWRAERLHRRICKDYWHNRAFIEEERTAFQQSLLAREAELLDGQAPAARLDELSRTALEEYDEHLQRWTERLKEKARRKLPRMPLAWLYEYRRDGRAGIPK